MAEEMTATEAQEPQVAAAAQEAAQGRSPEDYEKEIAELRRESAKYRTQRNELQADAEAYRKQQEAEKTELQRAQESINQYQSQFEAIQAENLRLRLASKYGIAEENIDLLGSGDAESLEDRAQRIAEMQKKAVTPPPSQTPVEKLGAVHRDDSNPPDAFPSNWPV
ncbi:MAG: hypothetical protein Q3976_07860 [Corynebacterium sp.]|nr:hypothetical protein [Corynebacterium sp.]